MTRLGAMLLLLLAACSSSSSDDGNPSGSSGSSGAPAPPPGSPPPPAPPGDSCATDPLKTGLTAQQTGVSVDAFDCAILRETAKQGEPDAMIVKAIIYVESRFDHLSVACPNLPCGTPSGWTADESGCFGLMQIVPACGGAPNKPGILPNGHPDLAKDAASPDWVGSVFNPDVNIAIGVAGLADNRSQEKKKFPGCSDDQYTMMTIGDYNSYGSTKSCTVFNSDYTKIVLDAYAQYAKAAGYTPHPY